MSHYTLIRTRIREVPILLSALHKMGYSQVEHHEKAEHLFGFQGDRRPETAEVIIRRQYIGAASNDVGFKRQESGEFQAIVSEFDRHQTCSEKWLQELNRHYAYDLVKEQAREQNLILEEEQEMENGDVVIVLSERG